jgi:hypothetical protein
MTDESSSERRSMASHWKMAGLVAGGLAVGYALLQEQERLAAAVAHVQSTLTSNGLTMMQKLSETVDTFLANVHQTFVAAAPPTNIEAVVRHGLTGRPENPVVIPGFERRSKSSRTRSQDNDDTSTNAENAHDPHDLESHHRARRTRHTQPEQGVTPSQLCSSQAAASSACGGRPASPHRPEVVADALISAEQHRDKAANVMAPSGDEPKKLVPKGTDITPHTAMNDASVNNEPITTLATTYTTALAQRAQLDPASLLGARLSATWVNDMFKCDVLMIRDGKHGRSEALVRYEDDNIEQWEVIGEPPYMHTLITEPADIWLGTGSVFIGAKTLERINSREFEGVVMAWLPKRDGLESLYKIYHVKDGDFGELDDTEVETSVALYVERTNSTIVNK